MTNESLRKCKTCSETLPLSAYRVAKRPDGKVSIRGSCKKCEAEKQRKWREGHPEENKSYMKTYLKGYAEEHKDELTQYKKEYYQSNKEEHKQKNHTYYQDNKESISIHGKEYYKKNSERIKARNKNWRSSNLEHCSKYKKTYYQENKDDLRDYKRKWYSTPSGKASNTKHACKRRRLGYNPINKKFDGSVYHHLRCLNEEGKLDNDIGIYIPTKLHESVKHDGDTGKGMNKINKLALEWYFNNTNAKDLHPAAKLIYNRYTST